jgi:uncharacterized OsmC-like protein
MELWERSAALDLLDDLLRESGDGGRVAVVAGEAGLGKTAVVTEFARRCGARARVLWGGCDRLVTPRALGPLHDIARQTGGDLAARLRAGAAQEEIFAALLDELSGPRQRPRPVVVVEDAHWADEATLDWLTFLGRRIHRLPALLVVTHRDDEVGPEHPLRGALATLPSAVVRRVSLSPLSQACVTEQARRAERDAELVYRLGGGNPLLVTELLKADGATVPAAVQDLILDRMRALPAPARELAQLVAVVPTRADAAIVAGAADAVDRCIGAGVLVPAGDGVSFRHELLRGAAEDSLSPARRTDLHRRVLGILVGVAGIDPGRLVHHARLAGDAEAVLRYGQVAGDSAARQGAHREAARHYGAAAAVADRLPEPQRAELLERYALEAHLTGRNEQALQAREAALTIREALGQPERVGENLRWISRASWWSGRVAYAREAAARAVAVLEAAPVGRQRAMAYSNQAQVHVTTHELDEAIAWGERARLLAEQLGDGETAIHATVTVQTARLASGEAGAPAALEGVHERAAALGFVDQAGRALQNLAMGTADELAEYAAAVPLVDRTLRYQEEHDLDGMYMLGSRAKLRLERGDWSGALADADATLARSGPLGVAAVLPLVVQGRIQAARGDAAALSTLDQAAQAAEGVGDVPLVAPVADARSPQRRRHRNPLRHPRRGQGRTGGGEVPIPCRQRMDQRHPQPQHHLRLPRCRRGAHARAQLPLRRRPPAVLVGRDNGPTPVEYVLHALAACLTAGLANIAAARKIRLTEVHCTVSGDIDLNGILGLDPGVRNGYQNITVLFTVKGDAPAEKLREIVEQSRARSAVYDVITNQVPVTIKIDAS